LRVLSRLRMVSDAMTILLSAIIVINDCNHVEDLQ